MRMIPDSPYSTRSNAEKAVFDDLRMAFSANTENDFICFHSLNLTRHAYKRFGEIDFLICSPFGLYVIEVKGGRVACHEGIWQYTDRKGNIDISREGPFKQAETALHGLMTKLKERLPSTVISEMVVGYGVISPDCELGCVGAEWDPQVLFDKGSRKNIQSWLESLFTYWRKKDPKQGKISPDSLKLLRQFLRPNFEAVVPLYAQAGAVYDVIDRLTEDQMFLVDIVAANTRVLCSGGAGTGKTFLAVELARRWTGEGLNVALICRSPWLKHFLQSKFSIVGLTVTTVAGMKAAASRQDIGKFGALIIDEGQDLLYMDNLDTMDPLLKGGINEGQWCFFHDVNNQSGFFGAHDNEALEYLKSLGAANVPLSTNCRNTRIILDKIKMLTGADMGVRGAGEGPEVRETYTEGIEKSALVLKSEIDSLVGKDGLAPSQITILSLVEFKDSPAAMLPARAREQITVLDEYAMQSFPPAKISFSLIKNFKGLENEAIIVVGLPRLSDKPDLRAEHYVAMSRAKALLSIIYMP